ncbi:hypothetical protein CDN99_07110 [Roseateles aquatilis]|uniref:Uncharacterized protein n=1 Tax=Roseateles aquatilis TaxID=431061 RepID=A0A246JHK8_9BURK|nr:hypothetical protein [Roseateles aquatilis]OWQ92114.1 hypothetical protein CDN99_07110 [Roseateles aquatilis]
MNAFFPFPLLFPLLFPLSRGSVEAAGGCAERAAIRALCRRAVLAALLPAGLSCAQAASNGDSSTPTSLDDHVELTGRSLADRAQLPRAQASSRFTVTQSAAEPLATANQPSGAAGWYGRAPQATQTMMWAKPLRASALRVGLGVEQRAAMIGGGLYATPYQNLRPGASTDAGVLVGLAMPTGPRSHAFVQTPLIDAPHPQFDDLNTAGLAGRDARQVRVGMVFNSSKPYADLRKGFKMELSGQSSLTLRPRGGRVGVTFQKIW